MQSAFMKSDYKSCGWNFSKRIIVWGDLIMNQKNTIMLTINDAGLFISGQYYDNLGVGYELKSIINRGMFVDTVLITLDDPEIDVFQSFVCRYRLRGDGGVDFYPNKHDLLMRDGCKLLVNGVENDKNR